MIRLFFDNRFHLTGPDRALPDPLSQQRNFSGRQSVLVGRHPHFVVDVIDQLDQVALLWLARNDRRETGISTSQHPRAKIEPQIRFLFVLTVAVPATLFEDRSDVTLKIDVVSNGNRTHHQYG